MGKVQCCLKFERESWQNQWSYASLESFLLFSSLICLDVWFTSSGMLVSHKIEDLGIRWIEHPRRVAMVMRYEFWDSQIRVQNNGIITRQWMSHDHHHGYNEASLVVWQGTEKSRHFIAHLSSQVVSNQKLI